ncbi:hypothetical protein ACLB2K_018055 [Fragaria x ananassa]
MPLKVFYSWATLIVANAHNADHAEALRLFLSMLHQHDCHVNMSELPALDHGLCSRRYDGCEIRGAAPSSWVMLIVICLLPRPGSNPTAD